MLAIFERKSHPNHKEDARSSYASGVPPPRKAGQPWSDPADQQFALVSDHGWKVIVQVDEQLFVADHLGAPGFVVERPQFIELVAREIQTLPFRGLRVSVKLDPLC